MFTQPYSFRFITKRLVFFSLINIKVLQITRIFSWFVKLLLIATVKYLVKCLNRKQIFVTTDFRG